MTRPSPTQAFLLRRAASRPGNLVLPLPDNLHGSIADRVLRALLTKGFIKEVEANIRRNEPVWRESGDGMPAR